MAERKISIHTTLQVGKYLVSPLTRLTESGGHAASVSIRSGRGSATHDRVLRFVPVFDSPDAAARFATAQGLAWIDCRAATDSSIAATRASGSPSTPHQD